jgi:hypothetical protein
VRGCAVTGAVRARRGARSGDCRLCGALSVSLVPPPSTSDDPTCVWCAAGVRGGSRSGYIDHRHTSNVNRTRVRHDIIDPRARSAAAAARIRYLQSLEILPFQHECTSAIALRAQSERQPSTRHISVERPVAQNRRYLPLLPWNMCSPAIFFV